MPAITTLDRAVDAYREGDLSWDGFVRLAVAFMQNNMCERHRLQAEERAEIVSDFYPRLKPMVEKYRCRGASFEAYLASTLCYYCRAYVKRKILRRTLESGICTLDGRHDDGSVAGLVEEPPPEPAEGCYDQELSLMQGPGQRATLRRQLLLVFCKNLPLLDSTEILRYATILDLPTIWVLTIVDYALRLHADRLANRVIMRERRNAHFTTMIRLERALKEETRPLERRHLLEKYRYHRRMWQDHIHRLKTQNVHLSHRELARLFGISKGSVDSSLYVLFKRLAIASSSG